MPNKKNIDEANRERALKLLEESDPELAKLVREEGTPGETDFDR
jgi:hypothetical protein